MEIRGIITAVWIGVLVLVSNVAQASAQESKTFDFLRSREEMHAMSQIGVAMTASLVCNVKVNHVAVASALDRGLGSGRAYNAKDMAGIVYFVLGQTAAQMQLLNLERPASRREYCATALKSYGPHGTRIPGLIE